MQPPNLKPCNLVAQTRQLLLDDITASWQQASSWTLRPSAAWVREYAVLPTGYRGETSIEDNDWPCGVWYLNEDGLHSRRVWDYTWFHIFQVVQPWCSLSHSRPHSAIWGRHKHEIGLISFAPLEGGPMLYVEHVYGGTTGGGDLYRVDEQERLEHVKVLIRF